MNKCNHINEVNGMIPSMLREGGGLRPTARILWEIQAKTAHTPVETATNLYRDCLRRAQEALLPGDARRNAVDGPESLRMYQQECREAFLRCIGGTPKKHPANAKVTGITRHEGFSIERVTLSSRPGNCVTANVYVPEGRTQPGPAVLVVVGHTDAGKADGEYQCVAQTLAHAGFVAIVTDPLGEGERFEQYEAEMAYQPVQGCSGEHDLLDWKAKLLGQSLARYFIQDDLAALDYLVSRPDVDASRVALTGHSGGGTQTVMLMLAAGERFAAAAPCAYVSDNQGMMDCGVDPDNEMMWPGSMAAGLDYVDLLAGMCPKPILALTQQNDFFPREGMRRTMAKARDLWQRVGAETAPDFFTTVSDHAYTPECARAAARFFSRHLMGREADLSGFVFRPLPAEALRCTPEGQVITACPGMRTVHDELCARLDELTARRGSVEAALPGLRKTLRTDMPLPCPEPRIYDEGVCGHVVYRCVAWRPDDIHWNVGALLRDMRHANETLPTVIALWPQGVLRIAEHSHWIHTQLRQGRQVLVMDLCGSGALLPAKLSGSDYYSSWSTMYKLNAYLIQLGDSLAALRTRQVMAAIAMLKGWAGAACGDITLMGMGECSRYALLASLMTATPVTTDGQYQPWAEIVRERWHDQTNTHEWIIPGVLEHTDMPEIVQYLTDHGLLSPAK